VKQRNESIAFFLFFSIENNGRVECAAYVMEKYQMTIDREESRALSDVSRTLNKKTTETKKRRKKESELALE
jgi:hypothetical protein